jgi:hypothetical protein
VTPLVRRSQKEMTTAERTVNPATMTRGDLTPDPELENSQGQKRSLVLVSQTDESVASASRSRLNFSRM